MLLVSETPATYFARKLVAQMERQGLTAYRLAKLSGITNQSLSLILTKGQKPTWETVQRLCLALGVDCAEFLDPDLQLPEAEAPKKRGPKPKDAGAAPSGEKKPRKGRKEK
jgi:transcriptional regulator with XRE-family HTH domain